MFIAFFDIKGTVYQHFVLPNMTVNAAYYVKDLKGDE